MTKIRQGPTKSTASIPTTTRSCKGRRTRFALFVQVLFKLLGQHFGDQSDFVKTAKLIVFTSTMKNRAGDPDHSCLIASIKGPLHAFVGDAIWQQAIDFTQVWLRSKATLAQNMKFLSTSK